MTRLHLASLHLRAFRNYKHLDLEFSPGLNVIYGDNAQGKTNLLESVYFLATGKSHRSSRDQEMIAEDEPSLLVRANVVRRTGELGLELSLGHETRKALKINGLPEKKITRLIGSVAVVFFSPDDLQLIKGPPSGRRRFLDIELSQISQNYLHHLMMFQRVLQQRNALLRQEHVDQSSLAVWDEQFLDAGAQLVARRAAAVARLAPIARRYHELLSNGREQLRLSYQSQAWSEGSEIDLAQIRDRLASLLQERRREEIRRQMTVVGPQRDDLAFFVDDRDARLYASQGQQRTAVLALKLAELQFMRDEIGESPLLLLDDVASELDPHRRNFLLQTVEDGIQTFVSCTDLEDLMARAWPPEHRLYRVTAGSVSWDGKGL